MLAYFLRRVALTVPTFLALMFLTFVAIRLVPGDPVEVQGRRAWDFARTARLLPSPARARPAAVEAVLRLCVEAPARRLRRVAGDAAEGADRVPDAVSGDAGVGVLRHDVRGPRRRARRRDRGGQARQRVRPGADDRVAVRLFDADLLVGPAAHHVRLGQARAPARVGPHRPHQLLFRPADRLHDHRRADVRPARRFRRRASPSRSAGDRARHRAARRHRAHDALLDARGPERGLCANRPRQGAVAGPRHRRACAAQRAFAGGDGDRSLGLGPDGRRRADGDDFFLAGRRQMADRIRSAGATIRRCRAA